ncbi:hypothetical protein SH591_06500 [Sphingomonas sp. LY54]|uniref:hypothetical protein n=1 Tax=Sphingomonas sp. LY54 TaxID=3095343 RepID=UPI002D78BCFD|nr:hypothetical protein [Sphingomonas sp. LY54]WRP29826.1 hypothetical protein SH591_06500 [Sphingomonas sp. LY54]
MRHSFFLAPTLIALAACGGSGDPVDNTADQLEAAADQSDPAAAQVLDNAADQVREQDDPALANGALEEAANAQADTVGNNIASASEPANSQ